jgi:type IV pilus assembly protein PilQ
MRREFFKSPIFSVLGIFFMLFSQATVLAQEVTMDLEQEELYDDQMAVTEERTDQRTGEVSRNVTLDFKEADILLVLRLLSLKSGVNIVAGPEVEGTVTVRLNDVPWDKALDVVLRTYGYVYERDGNIIRVTTRENLAAEDLATEAFILNYSTASEIADAISEIITERGRIKAVPRTNTVIVTDVATNIYKIGEIIKRLDKRTPQVYIDSKIVQTTESVLDQLGIDWQPTARLNGSERSTTFPFRSRAVRGNGLFTPFDEFFPWDSSAAVQEIDTESGGQVLSNDEEVLRGGYTSVGTLDFTSFSATLNFLKSRSSTKVISNPRIVTLSNQTAKVQVGVQIGIPQLERNESTGSFEVNGYEMRDTGIVLKVTPHVNDANEILVELAPEVSLFLGYEAIISGSNLAAPKFNTTQAETQVLIKDQETIAIGGLMKDAESTSYSKLPFLGDIPGLGRIFRREVDEGENEQTETIFFVTCTIVDTKGGVEFEEI